MMEGCGDDVKQIDEVDSSSSSSSCDKEGNGKDPIASDTKLKVVSWNINGLRTLNMQDVLKQLDASIVMVQETKVSRGNQLDQSQVIPPGYSSYFSFSTNRIGYSGVATFCKEEWTPSRAEEGICLQNLKIADNVGCYPEISDEEESDVKYANADGRTVITQHIVQLHDGSQRPLTFINVYCPRLRNDPDDPSNNTDLKFTFHDVLHRRAKLLVESGSFVALAGDINISHRWIDHCDGDPKTFVVNDFRKLLDQFISEDGFVDSFRMFHPDKESAFTCWNIKLNARENNYGTRIDYIFVDKLLASYLEKAEIHSDIMGSDHCPISITLHSLRPVSQIVPPSFATKYYPEFKKKQTSLKEFMVASSKCTNMDVNIKKHETNVNIKKHETNVRSNVQSESKSKKRPLSGDTSKSRASKRVQQTSVKSFFVSNSKEKPISSQEAFAAQIMSYESSAASHNLVKNNTKSQTTEQMEKAVIPSKNASDAWKQLMKAPEVPLCKGHNAPCLKRTVKKKGFNFGREFWSCPHGIGKSDDPNANCNFFQWVNSTVTKNTK